MPSGAGRAYRRTVARLTADAGTMLARVWAVWQRINPLVRG